MWCGVASALTTMTGMSPVAGSGGRLAGACDRGPSDPIAVHPEPETREDGKKKK